MGMTMTTVKLGDVINIFTNVVCDELWNLMVANESQDVTDEQFYATPLVHDGKLYIGNENTLFYALHLAAPIVEGDE